MLFEEIFQPKPKKRTPRKKRTPQEYREYLKMALVCRIADTGNFRLAVFHAPLAKLAANFSIDGKPFRYKTPVRSSRGKLPYKPLYMWLDYQKRPILFEPDQIITLTLQGPELKMVHQYLVTAVNSCQNTGRVELITRSIGEEDEN